MQPTATPTIPGCDQRYEAREDFISGNKNLNSIVWLGNKINVY